jgi:3-keto-disaccharide hydrolase
MKVMHPKFMILPMILLLAASHASAADSAPSSTNSSVEVPLRTGKLGEPIQLFNGKDLNGWVWFQRPPKPGSQEQAKTIDEVWTVKDGILHSAGKPIGYLRTDAEFTNYVLTVEERHIHKGNGGLLIGITGPDKVWPGLEIQTMTDNAGDLWNHNLLKTTTDPDRTKNDGRRIVKIGPDSQQPVGQWDTMEVIVDNGNLVYKVNGQVQNVATATESLAGKIGLQAEGAEMEFRKIQLTPIESAAGSK